MGLADYVSKSADTTRGPSQAVWSQFDILRIINDPNYGLYFWDDFNNQPTWIAGTGVVSQG